MEDIKAAEVCRNFYLGDMARKLLTPDQTAKQYLELLIQNKQYIDGVRVLAYALPIQAAIVWANLCAQYSLRADPSETSTAASEAVNKWLAEPNDENRRAAMKAAEAAEFGTPAGSAALAVFFSGGSIAPADAPIMNPQEYAAQNAVVGSVLLAATLKDPEKAEANYLTFIAEGLKLGASSPP